MCEMLPFRRIKIKWKKIGSCDYSASHPPYFLRAERMDGWYWWRVYRNNDTIAEQCDEEYKFPATRAKVAKLRAVKALNKWRKEHD